jgi:hypothetical protein
MTECRETAAESKTSCGRRVMNRIAMLDNGASCLSVARRRIHGEVCRELEMACQNAGLSPHEITILKRG